MSTEEPSSKDATVIDDDLVAALGFEPTVRSTDAAGQVLVAADDYDELDGAELNGSAAVIDEAGTDQNELDESDPDDLDTSELNGSAAVIDGAETDEVADDTDVEVLTADDAVPTADDAVSTDEGIADDLTDEAAESTTVDSVEAEDAVDDAVEIDDEADTDLTDTDLTDDEAETAAAGFDDDEATALIDLTGDDLEISEADDETDAFTAATFADTDLADTDLAEADAAGSEADLDAISASVFAPDENDLDTDDGEADLDGAATVAVPAAATIGLDLEEPAVAPAVTAAEPKKGRRRTVLRARKSRRVVRHIDPWSVLWFSFLFHICFFAAMLLASVLVWRAADAAGTIANAESFIMELGDYETFEIHGDVVFRAAVLIAAMLTLASSVMVVLLTVVFNLISDLIGGIRVTVLEEERVRVPAGAGRRSGRKASA